MSQKPVSSTFQTLLIFLIIFSPLDLVFFSTNFTENSQSPELAAYSHSAADSPKKVSPKTPPKKVESSPTTHVTETSFLHVLDPPDHFGTIYIFDHFFTFGLFFFQQIFPKKVRVQSEQHIHIQQQIREKKLVQKHPQKRQSRAPQPTSQKPVFSPFQTLLISFIIFSPLDLVFFQQILPKKVRFQSQQHIHIQQQIRQKSQSPKTPPKQVESSPTTHVTETSFLHVLDPPDHFGTIYIFNHFFTFGLFFFQQIFPKKVRVQSEQHIHIQQQIRQKKLVQKHPQKMQSRAPQPTSQKPVFSTFQTLLISFIIVSPLDLVFYQQILPKKVRVQSQQHIHIQQQIRQKKLVQKHPQKRQSRAPQPTSQKPVSSTFQTLLIILVPSTFSIIFSPLDCFFFNKFSRKKLESRVSSIFTFSSRFAKNLVQKHPQKRQSRALQPTSQIPVFSPFQTLLISFIIFSPLDLVFFQQILPKKVRVQSQQHIHIQQQIRQKSQCPKTPPKQVESSPTTHVTETRFRPS